MTHSKKHDLIHIIRLFLIVFIPIALLAILYFRLSFNKDDQHMQELIQNEQTHYLESIELFTQHQYEELYENLTVIAQANETRQYMMEQTKTSQTELQKLFIRIATSKPSFDQIRLLDRYGMELIRVNNSETAPIVVPSHQLQDKSGRDYYKASKKLNPGEIYVSSLDLNIENSEIEFPHKPVIRVATKLQNQSGDFVGILIINYNARNLFSVFEGQAFNENDYSIHPHILNSEGYYLYHPDPEKTFGFILNNRSQHYLALDEPEFWKKIQASSIGIFRKGNDLYTYKIKSPGLSNQKVIYQEQSWIFIAHKDLSSLPMHANLVLRHISHNELVALVILALIILAAVAAYYYSRKDKSQFLIAKKISLNTNDAFFVTDHKNRIIDVNETFELTTGYTRDELYGKSTEIFHSYKNPKSFYDEIWLAVRTQGEWNGPVWFRSHCGSLFAKALRIYAINDPYTRRTTMHIGIFKEISGFNLENLALIPLDPLHDRSQPHNMLQLPVQQDINEIGGQLFFISFRIENLASLYLSRREKRILLIEFSKRIQNLIESNDTLMRINDDLFLLCVTSIQDQLELTILLDMILANLSYPVELGNNKIDMSVKAGISIYPTDSNTANDLALKSYLALQLAERTPNCSYSSFDPELQQMYEFRQSLKSALKPSLKKNEYYMVYQPLIDIKNNLVVGAEALIRWDHPTLGSVPPSVFIPLAEEEHFIVRLGYWITETVFKDLKEIQAHLPKDFRISVNLSVLQFKDPHLLNHFMHTAEKYGVDPNQIEIEITETVLMTDMENIRPIIEEFRSLGTSVAIDDFGTGFSSLSYLHRLPLNKLKVDRSFIKNVPDSDDGKMAKVIADLAKTLDLPLLMEGVETVEQIDFLLKNDYRYIQGYFFSKPLSKNKLIDYLINSKSKS